MLERLEKENLFVIALDDERRWYRYHCLLPTSCVAGSDGKAPSAWANCTSMLPIGTSRTGDYSPPSSTRSPLATTNGPPG